MKAPPTLPELAPGTKRILLKNNLRQVLHLNIRDAAGIVQGIELAPKQSIPWVHAGDMGPDVDAKLRRKYLSLAQA